MPPVDPSQRGFVATLSDGVIKATDGRPVWDLHAYDFIVGDAPASAHPGLWEHMERVRVHGLFEVTGGIYQVRGFDLSNMTIVEGSEGVLVIDPLISAECAAAALELYRAHRGDRPVTGLLYTHSHVDHFGGARGVTDGAGGIPVLAPEGFLEHAISENVFAGPAMGRRATYMYGAALSPGPDGTLGASLGMTTSSGTITLVPPTVDVVATGQVEVVDGIRLEFQMTPGTEAPAEMNFHLPDFRAFCIAENATHNLHNVLTLRGALVRDAHMWSKYLGETLRLLRDDVEVMFAGHHWPTWGRDAIVAFISQQRDLYGYLHDQTLRLMNRGYVGAEIAELIELPPSLADEWHCRGFYGSVSHNVKAIYQRYMGWFDGNPAHLWQHPPEEAARRYVEYMGGAEAVLKRARAALEEGDLRWVAEVVNHLVFADPSNGDARALQAEALERLGFGSENATWRNFYLTGASELRGAEPRTATTARSLDLVSALSSEQLLDAFAIRIDGPRAWGKVLRVNWVFPATGERFAVTLSNGVLTHAPGTHDDPDGTITVNREALNVGLSGGQPEAAPFEIDGDQAKVGELFGLLDQPDPGFDIVLP